MHGSDIFVFRGLKKNIYLKATLQKEKFINETNEEVVV